jgi:hypothetical protein
MCGSQLVAYRRWKFRPVSLFSSTSLRISFFSYYSIAQTLKELFSLPPGFEKTDPSLASLIRAARNRDGPRPYGYEEDDEYDDDDDRWCTIS